MVQETKWFRIRERVGFGGGAVVFCLHSHRLFFAPHMAMPSIERYQIHRV